MNGLQLIIIMLRKITLSLKNKTNSSFVQVQSQLFTIKLQKSTKTQERKLTQDKFLDKILQKSQQGRALAQSITESTPLNKFERDQRYEIFINKMNLLYKNHRAFQTRANQAFRRMRNANVLFQTPVKQVLSEYNKLTSNGFNCEILASSLENLQSVLQARGNKPLVQTDYTISEMDQSWRMDKIAEDIKFGLTNETVFFSPKNMARSSRQLGEMGYKNTELISIWLQSLQQKLNQKDETSFVSAPGFEEVVYGSMKNFTPRYYVFQGFQSDEEFESHLKTLMEFQVETRDQSQNVNKTVQKIEDAMQKVMDAAKEIRDLQVDQQAAIESLREQFFKLKAAQNKHIFLQKNKYLVLDMLELQELLVKGGYLDPQEALIGASESIDERMQRASSVFYDLVLNYTPELLSPQYEAFYQATISTKQPSQNISKENQNKLNLGFLSETLVGLAEQAQSPRRDVKDKDYPNEFYEKLLIGEEIGGAFETQEGLERIKSGNALMEASYLNGWRNFTEESSKIIKQHFKKLIAEEKSIDGLVRGLRALSACKFEAKNFRDTIINRAVHEFKDQSQKVSTLGCVDGLVGLAECAYKSPNANILINKLIENVDSNQLNFSQQCELLNAITLLSSSNPSVLDFPLVEKLVTQISMLEYEAIDNDLTYRQYNQLYEAHQTLRFMGKNSFRNHTLFSSLQGKDLVHFRFSETIANDYDPLKGRVVAGLARGITAAELNLMKNQQEFNEHVANLTLKPDILTGYKGKQLAIYVLNNRQVMHDTLNADGRTTHLASLCTDIKPVSVAIQKIVDYDLQNFKLKIRDDFDLNSLLGFSQAELEKAEQAYTKFARFASSLTHIINESQISNNFDTFINQLAEFFILKSRIEYLHEYDQLVAANDELKISLIKLILLHDSKLSSQEKDFVQQATSGSKFSDIVNDLKKDLQEKQESWELHNKASQLDPQFDFNWHGVRYSVELPQTDSKQRKKIEPELISKKFLTYGNYHYYDDWKQLMQDTYDQFNLMQLNEPGIKLNFDFIEQNRRVPKGIFPLPNIKREILISPGTQKPDQSHNDRFTKFEADPHKFMLQQELAISKKLKDVTPEVSLISNLQNIKQALLANHTDEQICKKLLQDLTFTDNLINEHLSKKNNKKNDKLKFLPRDPASFRKYMESKPETQSAFNQYFLKEGLKQIRAKEIYNEVMEKQRNQDLTGIEKLQDELEQILLKNERENEDNFNLSSALPNYVKINVDLKSLGVLDSPLTSERNFSLTDEQFLHQERCLAESRLIKSKIIYKLHKGIELSLLENKYLKAWSEEMSKHDTLIQDCLVPKFPSKLTLNNLTKSELKKLNSLSRVQIQLEQHGEFALNDLVVELSHVFDNQTVRAVELSFLQENMKYEWQLSKEFKLFSQRNKEIDNVIGKYDELAWRSSAKFTTDDIKYIKEIFLIGRGLDSYDNTFINQDTESFNQFMTEANDYDSRIQLLETWLFRKEQEINSRTNLPTPELAQPDKVINQILENTYKPAREKIVAQILSTDQEQQKKYSELNQDELHDLVEGLCVRLNLFNSEYPKFLPHAIRAIIEHPNLQRSDRSTIDAFCKIFKLDWRNDTHAVNSDEFMSTNPIYIDARDQSSMVLDGNITNEKVTSDLKAACKSYLPQITKKIFEIASK